MFSLGLKQKVKQNNGLHDIVTDSSLSAQTL